MQHARNPCLNTIKKNYLGNSVQKNKFINEYTNKHRFSLRKAFANYFVRSKKKRELRREKHTIPVLHLNKLPSRNKDSIVWFGHCSFLLTLAKKRILLDPQLSSHPYLKRKTIPPCKPDILTGIDYVCISHAHRDHLDKKTIQRITPAKSAKALVPLGVGKYIQQWNKKFTVEQAGWWQAYNTKNIKFFFLPAKHWANRGLFDINKSLWGSFIIQSKNKTIYFAGDTAYSNHFKDIHKQFPNIDIALMPIGAYEPEDLMLPNHMNPEQSVSAFDLLKAKTFIPTHYGTFVLSDDSSEVSLSMLRNKIKAHKDNKKLLIPAVGEVIYL